MSNRLFEQVMRPAYVGARRAARRALFDRRYGVDTEGALTLEELGTTDPRSTEYAPVGLLSLRRILPRREVGPDDVFIDVGSGKGRAVLQAAMQYPFRRVYGVEMSEQLHETAERNLERVRHRLSGTEVHFVRANVLDYTMPDDVTVALFNNPFRGEVFDTAVTRLLESVDRNVRRLRVIYGNPVEEAALLRTGRFRLVRATRGLRPGLEWSRSNSLHLYELTNPDQPARRPNAR